MTGTREAVLTRVSSVDGTEIACWTTGDGPPLVLVHGATADHTRWAPVLPHLEPHFTVHAIDRRGRGASGDAADYTVEREYDDVAAVVDAVAAQAGAAVDLLGHSFGGVCAFGAATRTSHLRRLVLYEGWPTPHPEALALPADVKLRMDALLAVGDREGVLEVFFREIVAMPEADFAIYRALPGVAGPHPCGAHDRPGDTPALPAGTVGTDHGAGAHVGRRRQSRRAPGRLRNSGGGASRRPGQHPGGPTAHRD